MQNLELKILNYNSWLTEDKIELDNTLETLSTLELCNWYNMNFLKNVYPIYYIKLDIYILIIYPYILLLT